MDRLIISPLRGLYNMGYTLSYNHFIPSGLKKMTLKVNHENMPVMYHFGLKILFDGYLIGREILCDGYVIKPILTKCKTLIISLFLCDGYVMNEKILFDGYLIGRGILCDGYVTKRHFTKHNQLNINEFLCDNYVTNKLISFDGHLINMKL